MRVRYYEEDDAGQEVPGSAVEGRLLLPQEDGTIDLVILMDDGSLRSIKVELDRPSSMGKIKSL